MSYGTLVTDADPPRPSHGEPRPQGREGSCSAPERSLWRITRPGATSGAAAPSHHGEPRPKRGKLRPARSYPPCAPPLNPPPGGYIPAHDALYHERDRLNVADFSIPPPGGFQYDRSDHLS